MSCVPTAVDLCQSGMAVASLFSFPCDASVARQTKESSLAECDGIRCAFDRIRFRRLQRSGASNGASCPWRRKAVGYHLYWDDGLRDDGLGNDGSGDDAGADGSTARHGQFGRGRIPASMRHVPCTSGACAEPRWTQSPRFVRAEGRKHARICIFSSDAKFKRRLERQDARQVHRVAAHVYRRRQNAVRWHR